MWAIRLVCLSHTFAILAPSFLFFQRFLSYSAQRSIRRLLDFNHANTILDLNCSTFNDSERIISLNNRPRHRLRVYQSRVALNLQTSVYVL